jgi:transcription-repair coupling factor (superfamily II helicase)
VKVDAGPEAMVLQFQPNPPIDPARIIQLIQTRRNFKLSGQDRLRIEEKHAGTAERVQRVKAIFRELVQPAKTVSATR